MASKIMQLTDTELSSLIYDISMSTFSDTDNEKYKASFKVYDGGYKDKLANISICASKIDNELVSSFVNAKFMFFAESGIGIPYRVIFILKSIQSVSGSKIVMEGIVILNTEVKKGKIHITNGVAKIIWNHDHYILEPDNRTKQSWKKLLEHLNVISHE